jgi:2'-5' RNA ligase
MSANSYILVHFVERQSVGTKWLRKREEWPFHITLVPWFDTVNRYALDSLLEQIAKSTAPFEALVGKRITFGETVNVHLIDDQADVKRLHTQLLAVLQGLDFQFQSDSIYIADNYRAHITEHQVGNTLAPDDQVDFSDFSLVQLLELPNGQCCEVLKNFSLQDSEDWGPAA